MTDRDAETRSLVALDIERWSSRNAIDQRHLQEDLLRLVDAALGVTGLDPAAARRQYAGDGLLLSFPAEVPKRALTQPFVQALDEGLREHAYTTSVPERRMRLRLAMHSGDIVDDGTAWQGPAVVEVCRLLDADVLRRVLRDATTSVLALLVSAHWHREVVHAGWAPSVGYRHVRAQGKDGAREAWIRVPGLSEPPGLLPDDAWPQVTDQADQRTPGRSDSPGGGTRTMTVDYSQHAENGSTISNDHVDVRDIHGGTVHIGPRTSSWRGGNDQGEA